jgi:hypothetical protein
VVDDIAEVAEGNCGSRETAIRKNATPQDVYWIVDG